MDLSVGQIAICRLEVDRDIVIICDLLILLYESTLTAPQSFLFRKDSSLGREKYFRTTEERCLMLL
jgi:hypothetical protein